MSWMIPVFPNWSMSDLTASTYFSRYKIGHILICRLASSVSILWQRLWGFACNYFQSSKRSWWHIYGPDKSYCISSIVGSYYNEFFMVTVEFSSFLKMRLLACFMVVLLWALLCVVSWGANLCLLCIFGRKEQGHSLWVMHYVLQEFWYFNQVLFP